MRRRAISVLTHLQPSARPTVRETTPLRYRNTEATASAVNVEVTFFDGGGRQLSKEVIALSNLEAGATAAFRTHPQRLADVTDYTIYVNTGRNMYGN